MKYSRAAVVVFAALALSACGPKSAQGPDREAEIERRVQERLREERLAQVGKELNDKQLNLEERERLVQEREKLLASRDTDKAPRSAQPPTERDPERSRPIEVGRAMEDDLDLRPPAPPPIAEGGAEDSSYTVFYDRLEPYGNWIETNDYGYVWHPNAVSAGWRPYTDGYWAYTDYGWTWVSYEPFGWATYHYGRWARLQRLGWVWVPGNEWAPAWVSWRAGGDYVGWAPLPPEALFERRRGIQVNVDAAVDIGPANYFFVSVRNFGAPRIDSVIIEPQRNLSIIRDTRNITRIESRNNAIINQGPSFADIEKKSLRPMKRMNLERQFRAPDKGGTVTVKGNVLQIPAPMIEEPKQKDKARPKKVSERIADAKVERGWADVKDRKEADQLRQQMKEQARQQPAPQASTVSGGPQKEPARRQASIDAPKAQRVDEQTAKQPMPPATVAEPTPTPAAPAPAAKAVAADSQETGKKEEQVIQAKPVEQAPAAQAASPGDRARENRARQQQATDAERKRQNGLKQQLEEQQRQAQKGLEPQAEKKPAGESPSPAAGIPGVQRPAATTNVNQQRDALEAEQKKTEALEKQRQQAAEEQRSKAEDQQRQQAERERQRQASEAQQAEAQRQEIERQRTQAAAEQQRQTEAQQQREAAAEKHRQAIEERRQAAAQQQEVERQRAQAAAAQQQEAAIEAQRQAVEQQRQAAAQQQEVERQRAQAAAAQQQQAAIEAQRQAVEQQRQAAAQQQEIERQRARAQQPRPAEAETKPPQEAEAKQQAPEPQAPQRQPRQARRPTAAEQQQSPTPAQ